MNDLNSVLIEGNLTRDPVLATTPKGTAVCNFSVASNRYYYIEKEKQEEVSFFDVESWSKLAERCGDELTKGRGVRVVGRLKQDRWEDKDGNPRSRMKVVAEHVEFRRPRVPQDDDEQLEDGTDELVESGAAVEAEEKEAAVVF